MQGVDTLVVDGGSPSVRLSGRRSRVLDQLKTNLRLHSATDSQTVQYSLTRDGIDLEVVGEFDPDRFVDGVAVADEMRMEINWWTHPDEIEDQFKFHYIESTGYDCGWHRQPHPEESEIPFDHFQQRATPDTEYHYQGVAFQEKTPVGLLWEVTNTRLPRIIRSRWTDEE